MTKIVDYGTTGILIVLLVLISWAISVSIMNTGNYIEEHGIKSIVSDLWLGSGDVDEN